MSIKSLLQIILILLIIIIVGGIYYVYFYTSPVKKHEISKLSKDQNIVEDQEILGEITINKDSKSLNTELDNKKKIDDQKDGLEIEENIVKKKQVASNEDKSLNTVKNLTKEIEYVTSNKSGDIFKILAESGKTNLSNSDILILENVSGTITSLKKSDIFITSKYAEYNFKDQNSKFYTNVKISYNDRVITCENLDLKISENIAVAYNNVIVKQNNSILKAQQITMNILTNDINIVSNEKVKVSTN